ncbi:hypothetical protein EDB84DRAFT_640394 [Lactarius hengduanensis]|nr:hypothetical protein EDB84DRAFT_640394 [Lactarius hengduanensis]
MHPCKLMQCRRGRSVPYSLTYKTVRAPPAHADPQAHRHWRSPAPPRMDGMVVEVLCPSFGVRLLAHLPPISSSDRTELHEDHTGQYDATRGPPGFGLKKVTGLKDASERPFPHAHGERRAPNPRVSVSASTSATAPTSASGVPAWPRSGKGSGRRTEIGVGAVTPPAAGCDRVLVAATTRALRAE